MADVHIDREGKIPGTPVKDPGIHYYAPGPVAKAFLNDSSFICGIMGPFGSGKSTAAVMKIIKNMQSQKRTADGWIKRRTAIIRNTYPELRTTTMKTWHQWVPQHLGRWRDSGPPMHHIIDKRNKIDWEVLFVALDRPDDVSKLLSMELSDAWINEAREVPKAIMDGLTGRVGRYPAMWMAEPTNVQILMDTNPPDTDHWWYILAEQDMTNEKNRQLIVSMREAEDTLRSMGLIKKDQRLFQFYRQPSGRSPDAENVKNLRPGYYEFQMAGKDLDWIKVYIDGQYGFVMDGLPVYPEYKDSTHAGKPFEVVYGVGLRLGFDWGLTPACTISQRLANGKWLVHQEYVSERMGITTFGEEVAKLLLREFPGMKVVSSHGDPAGDAVTPEESTCFKIMTAAGIPTEPAPTQDPTRRREGLSYLLRTMIDGDPAIRIHPRCSILRKGLSGGFHRKRVQVTGDVRFKDVPEKNKYSHVCEAFEYDVVSAGEDRNVMVVPEAKRGFRGVVANSDYDEFSM